MRVNRGDVGRRHRCDREAIGPVRRPVKLHLHASGTLGIRSLGGGKLAVIRAHFVQAPGGTREQAASAAAAAAGVDGRI